MYIEAGNKIKYATVLKLIYLLMSKTIHFSLGCKIDQNHLRYTRFKASKYAFHVKNRNTWAQFHETPFTLRIRNYHEDVMPTALVFVVITRT